MAIHKIKADTNLTVDNGGDLNTADVTIGLADDTKKALVPAGGTNGQVLAKNSNDDGATSWQDAPSAGHGTGDVKGPAQAVGGNVALFDGTTGKKLKDGFPVSTFMSGVLARADAPTVRTALKLGAAAEKSTDEIVAAVKSSLKLGDAADKNVDQIVAAVKSELKLGAVARLDYQVNRFTPYIEGAAQKGKGEFTYHTQDGWYYKIDALVTIRIDVQVTAVRQKPSGIISIAGLPFSAMLGSWGVNFSYFSIGVPQHFGGMLIGSVTEKTSAISLRYCNINTGTMEHLPAHSINENSRFVLSATYETTSSIP